MAEPLQFRADRTFTVVQFTDLHWKNGDEKDLQTYTLMNAVLEREQPDLVVFTGDVIEGGHCRDPIESFRRATGIAGHRECPWAAVFGNHDDERSVTKERLLAAQQESEYCLSDAGPSDIEGVGNFVLPVLASSGDCTAAALYFLDSGGYAPESTGGYDWIRHSQIAWYREQSVAFTLSNHGIPLPSLAFFHIPLHEYADVWNRHPCYGHKHEGIGAAKVNSGLFAQFLEMGDVMGTFCGHDHVNDFWGELYGIRLCYGRATGYNTYGRQAFPRGARIIKLREDERGFDTWLRLDGESAALKQPQHTPEGRRVRK